MIVKPLPNINGSVIVVTNTATNFFDLVKTAASVTTDIVLGTETVVDALDIRIGAADIVVTWDGTTPTAALGQTLAAGAEYKFRGRPLSNLKMIRTGGSNVSCEVVYGYTQEGEGESAAALGGGSAVPDVNMSQVGGTTVDTNSGTASAGTQRTILASGATSTRTTVTPALTSAALIAANTSRKGLRIVHTPVDPTQNLWIAAAATATSAIFFTKLTGSGEVSLYDATEWPYSGQYSIISDVASGTVQVYELS